MKVQCAWCKKFSPPKEPLKDDSISHGICPKCAKQFAKNPGSLPNIEKSAFKRGEWVGYAAGVWRIYKDGGIYKAIKREGAGRLIGTTLRELSLHLSRYGEDPHSNPGESWHAGKMEEAERSERNVKKASLKDFYHGKAIAHFESALEERARTKTRKNPLAVFGLGNPPNHVSAKVAGIIYRRCIEVKAEKLGKFQKGFWRHPFDASSQVHVLALDNGDILLHSVAGVPLWERA